MSESDLDYAKATGRWGLTIADTDDVGDNPNIIYCDEGQVDLIPLTTITKVPGGTPVPFESGQAVFTATISAADYVDPTDSGRDGAGHLTYLGKPFMMVVDLTTAKVNPFIGEGLATHRAVFRNLKAAGTRVDFPPRLVRITKDGIDGDGVNDLSLILPVVAGAGTPIVVGPAGVSVTGAAIVDGTDLELELSDGSTVNAGTLPSGPGGSDIGVAGYVADTDSDTRGQLEAAFVRFVDQDGNPLPLGSVTTIHVNTTTLAIDDITYQEA